MDGDAETNLRRSISMPDKPKDLDEVRPLARSHEMEKVNDIRGDEDDYYPESPRFAVRSPPNGQSVGSSPPLPAHSQSFNNFSQNWSGSTIDLNGGDSHEVESHAFSKKPPNRVIEKNGRENVLIHSVPERSWRYMRDLVTTLIELDWSYVLTMFLGSYFFSWFFFAILCYVVAYAHGDLIVDSEAAGSHMGDGRVPCIVGVTNFRAMLIYSVETQTTIGFGEKYPSEECPETIFLFIMQIICSIAIEGAMVSVIYLKTARPVKQITKLKFSDKAVICYRDGKLCLLFRVCDLRKQQTIESKIRVYMVVDRTTSEGEVVKSHAELKLEGNGQQIIEWPEIVCHVIDEASPLSDYTKSAKTLNASQFELYVSIVGTSSSSAQLTEARTSYIPGEIFWGQSFVNIITYDTANGRYMIDYRNFNTTVSVDMQSIKDE